MGFDKSEKKIKIETTRSEMDLVENVKAAERNEYLCE